MQVAPVVTPLGPSTGSLVERGSDGHNGAEAWVIPPGERRHLPSTPLRTVAGGDENDTVRSRVGPFIAADQPNG